MSHTEQLISRKDVAKRLCVSQSTVDRRARDESEFPMPITIGRRVLYRSIEVDAYVKSRGLTAREAAHQRNNRLLGTKTPAKNHFAFMHLRRVIA